MSKALRHFFWASLAAYFETALQQLSIPDRIWLFELDSVGFKAHHWVSIIPRGFESVVDTHSKVYESDVKLTHLKQLKCDGSSLAQQLKTECEETTANVKHNWGVIVDRRGNKPDKLYFASQRLLCHKQDANVAPLARQLKAGYNLTFEFWPGKMYLYYRNNYCRFYPEMLVCLACTYFVLPSIQTRPICVCLWSAYIATPSNTACLI